MSTWSWPATSPPATAVTAGSIGQLVCPVSRLSTLVAELARSLPARPIDLSLVVDTGLGAVPKALSTVFSRASLLTPRTVETAAPPDVDAMWLDRVSEFVPEDVVAVVEPRRPHTEDTGGTTAWLEAVRRVAEHGCAPKLRCGGPRASDVPDSAHVEEFVQVAVETGRPFTALGLREVVHTQGRHGILNLLLAVARALAGEDVRGALENHRRAEARRRGHGAVRAGRQGRAGAGVALRRRPRPAAHRPAGRPRAAGVTASRSMPLRSRARRIGFLGPRATFAEQALRTLPEAAEAELVPCAGSPAVLAALRAGSIDAGFVPIENTVEGAVPAVLDGLVDDPPLVIVREAVLAVEFDLMARPGTRLADVRRVASHSHGIAQTRGWIAEHLPDAEVLLATSTVRGRGPGRARRAGRGRGLAAGRAAARARRCSRPTSPTTRARSPGSPCSAAQGRCPRPPATTAPPSPPPPRTAPARSWACSPSSPCAASTSPASSPARSRTGTPSTGSTSTASATSPSPRWARRWPRCTAAATASASSAPTRGRPTAGRPARRAPR